MNRTPIESESILERQHSCKWYFDEAVDFFDRMLGAGGEDQDTIRKAREASLLGLYIGHLDEHFKKELREKKRKDTYSDYSGDRNWASKNWKILSGLIKPDGEIASVFPLFVFTQKKATGAKSNDPDDLFERKKFEICKTLNAVDSIIARLCTENADEQSQISSKVVEPKTILKWLYTVADQGESSVQERNLINTLLQQVIEWYKEQKTRWADEEDKEPDINPSCNSWIHIFSDMDSREASDYGWTIQGIESVKADVKEALTLTLDDMSEAYEKLDGFRRYAIRVELAKDDMLEETELNKLLSLAQAILDFLLSVCVSYMRINDLKLPRTDFRDARLVHSNISSSTFSCSDFRGVDMSFAIAQDCDFSSASLANITGNATDFSRSLLSYADLSGAKLSDAILNGVKMDAVYLGQTSRAELYRIKDDLKIEVTPPVSEKTETSYLENFEKTVRGDKPKSGEYLSGTSIKDLYDAVNKITRGDHKSGDNGKKSSDVGDIVYWDNLSVDRDEYKEYEKNIEDKKGYKRVADLSNARVKGSILHDLDLSLIHASLASFSESDLSGCTMAYLNGNKAEFLGTNLSEAKLYQADLKYATFNKALAINTWFADCKMDSVNFSDANLTGARFVDFDEEDHIDALIRTETIDSLKNIPAIFEKNRQEDGNEKEKNEFHNHNNTFNDVIANNILISGIDFSRSTFYRAVFRNAMIFNMDSSSSVWDDADLTFALIRGAVFNRSSMKRCSLQEADIRAADFTCCNLHQAKMLGCLLDQVLFYDANLSEVNLSHSKIYNTVFRESLFDKLNCSKTEFVNCVFIGIDFTNCINLHNASFKDCIFLRCWYNEGKIQPRESGAGEGQYIKIGKVNLHAREKKLSDTVKFSSETFWKKEEEKK